ncbi:hypothetical protein SGRA_3232 [Saprospira grandis str. Lewin]|uniref:Uncharacterized protein n=1 Tax=Saprospira grandis (strain Lewin) TaxID=984262 RepID=H6L104_SAPGL|nr:hypothetical protein SGRA_3232 [Saprospira grandis str. Lewin]
MGLPLRPFGPAGRAVPQLAARSALRRLRRLGLALRATAIHPRPLGRALGQALGSLL